MKAQYLGRVADGAGPGSVIGPYDLTGRRSTRSLPPPSLDLAQEVEDRPVVARPRVLALVAMPLVRKLEVVDVLAQAFEEGVDRAALGHGDALVVAAVGQQQGPGQAIGVGLRRAVPPLRSVLARISAGEKREPLRDVAALHGPDDVADPRVGDAEAEPEG